MKPRKAPTPRGNSSPHSGDNVTATELEHVAGGESTSSEAGAAKPTGIIAIIKHSNSNGISDNLDILERKRLDELDTAPTLNVADAAGTGVKLSSREKESESRVGTGEVLRETRTRKSKNVVYGPNGTTLQALDIRGRIITLKLILANQPYANETTAVPTASPDRFLGHDGNQYFCQVCRGFGDVVCCDGCPRVYHPECVPLESKSRISLDNDDDPWYCPKCIEKLKSDANLTAMIKSRKTDSASGRRSSRGVEKVDRPSSQRRCADCFESRADITLSPCTGCGTYIHSPSCQSNKSQQLLCLICCTMDEYDDTDEGSGSGDQTRKKGQPEDNEGNMDQNDIHQQVSEMDEDEEVDLDSGTKRTKRKKASILPPSSDLKTKKKKKKKRKRLISTDVLGEEDEAARQQAIKDDPILKPRASGTVQAIPAFCFYLAENRWKLERALSRKHRTFNRLPKGDERNALVAQEAAVWWTKLPTSEHQRYINLSIRDFEARIILWKEEKNAREAGILDQVVVDDAHVEMSDVEEAAADRIRTYDLHERLYLSTSVGSKTFKLEPGQSYNRVLLELLHDARFHPLPMFAINKQGIDDSMDEHASKVTIPFFEVHGPISTSIGDECLGCSRGWTHYCSVLQQRVPAVEHRAKLQSPLSSLMATRIGLGLRPRLDADTDTDNEMNVKQAGGLLQWRECDEFKDLHDLPSPQSTTVFDPSDRADELVLFIEETAAMKIPEPPRPSNPIKIHQKKSSLRALPTQKQRELPAGHDENGDGSTFNKCGRCRTIISNDTGCVHCRRAQLVINKSKKAHTGSSKNSDGKLLKVHATMLGRLQLKDGAGEAQSLSDCVVSEAMLKERWCPSAILPPRLLYTPGTNKNLYGDTASLDESSIEIASEKQSVDTESLIETEDPSSKEGAVSPVDELDKDEPPTKRFRSARSLSMMFAEVVEPEADRQQLLKHFKKETGELQRKATQIACFGIMHALLRRDPLHLFDQPVAIEGYSEIVQNPIDFNTIRETLLAGKYVSLSAFVSDVRLLCDNAMLYNPAASIYHKTAKELHDALAVMNARASEWLSVVKGEYSKYLQSSEATKRNADADTQIDDPFTEFRRSWPEAVQMLEHGELLRRYTATDFMRTKENEMAFYACLAIRRAAASAGASLAPYTDSVGIYSAVSKRNHFEDEELRDHVDAKVAAVDFPQLKGVSSWREESILRLVRKVQKLRLERRTTSENGSSRCDGFVDFTRGSKTPALNSDITHPSRTKKKGELDVPRIIPNRITLATGLASSKTRGRILERDKNDPDPLFDSVDVGCVSVRGSKIHGMGVFADQTFTKGDVVAEYKGEYVVNAIADKREKLYEEQRIQDYQFRLDEKGVLDATRKGGWARYINHNCSPNCKTIIIPGTEPSTHLRRVLIVAQRDIELNEEISYDYQFPLEINLSARIPCNCQSEACRGFMNWDLPEKGSNNRTLLVQKRGANMRDRIRRLGRPLKRDEV